MIETPEFVELRQPLAGIGSRFIAGLIDHLLLFLGVFGLYLGLRLLGGLDLRSLPGQWAVAVLLVALFLLYFGYFAFFEMVLNGQSPGKRHMRLRIVSEGGGAASASQILIRNALRLVDILPFTYAVAGVFMFCTGKIQRLGDLAAGTVVVTEQVPNYASRADKRRVVEPPPREAPEVLREAGLKPREYQALASYWTRRDELTLEARHRILPRLMEPLFRRAGRKVDAESLTALEGYVAALLSTARSGQTEEEDR